MKHISAKAHWHWQGASNHKLHINQRQKAAADYFRHQQMRLSTGHRIAWPLHSARSWRLPWHCALLTAKKHESNKSSQRKCERLVKPLNWSIPNHNQKYKNQSKTYPIRAPWLQSLLETQAMVETQEQLPLPPAMLLLLFIFFQFTSFTSHPAPTR